MTVKQVLNDLVKVVLEEAEKNKDFAAQLNRVLLQSKKSSKSAATSKQGSGKDGDSPALQNTVDEKDLKTRRPSNRRSPAVLDPVQIARNNPESLQVTLSALTLEQLYDVVAEYGMDTGKLVLKWKDANRVIDRIVEVSIARAQKGDAFRPPTNQTESGPTSDNNATSSSSDEM